MKRWKGRRWKNKKDNIDRTEEAKPREIYDTRTFSTTTSAIYRHFERGFLCCWLSYIFCPYVLCVEGSASFVLSSPPPLWTTKALDTVSFVIICQYLFHSSPDFYLCIPPPLLLYLTPLYAQTLPRSVLLKKADEFYQKVWEPLSFDFAFVIILSLVFPSPSTSTYPHIFLVFMHVIEQWVTLSCAFSDGSPLFWSISLNNFTSLCKSPHHLSMPMKLKEIWERNSETRVWDDASTASLYLYFFIYEHQHTEKNSLRSANLLCHTIFLTLNSL